jgi:hypothetical protein
MKRDPKQNQRFAPEDKYIDAELASGTAAFFSSVVGTWFFFTIIGLGVYQFSEVVQVNDNKCLNPALCQGSLNNVADGYYRAITGVNLLLLAMVAFFARATAHLIMGRWSSTTLDFFVEIAVHLKHWLTGDTEIYWRKFVGTGVGMFIGTGLGVLTAGGFTDHYADLGIAQLSAEAAGDNWGRGMLAVLMVCFFRSLFVVWVHVKDMYPQLWPREKRDMSIWPAIGKHYEHALAIGAVEALMVLVFARYVGIPGYLFQLLYGLFFNLFSPTHLAEATVTHYMLFLVATLVAVLPPFMIKLYLSMVQWVADTKGR